ncbi:MAG: BrnT family toxin [Mesorhizobium sp.]
MKIGVVWDHGNWPKCGKHGVSQAEIEDVLANPATTIFDDPFPAEQRFRAIGKTKGGRHLFVVFTFRGDNERPVSARYMRDKEIRRYVEDQT